MPRPGPGAVPELFLTFLAPSLRPSLARPCPQPRHASTSNQDKKVSRASYAATDRLARRTDAVNTTHSRAIHSRATVRRTVAQPDMEAYVPVASTSAVRLDDPFVPCPPTRSPQDRATFQNGNTPLVTQDEVEQTVADLPAILARVKALSLDYPELSPVEIIARARQQAADARHANQVPPTPPPPITLNPEPYSTNSQFFTPFFLQAIMLGASALGLLARRKVAASEQRRDRLTSKTAREQAEDRIDEVQALNLLISDHAASEWVASVEQSSAHSSRCALVQAVARNQVSAYTRDRTGVASLLYWVKSRAAGQLDSARRSLGVQAFETYRLLPVLDQNASSVDIDVDTFTLSTLLSIIYPRMGSTRGKFFVDSPTLDRHVLDTICDRILSFDAHPEIVQQLGKAAARAQRLDIITRILALDLPSNLKLDLVVSALDLVASQKHTRSDHAVVVPFAEAFAATCERVGSLNEDDIERIDRGLYLLRTAFAINRPLEPVIARATMTLVSNLAQKRCRSIVVDSLRHLCRSRHPALAREIVTTIPSNELRLSYLYPLLASSHHPTSQATWTALLSHDRLSLTNAAVSARFASLSHRSAARRNLDIARQDFTLVKQRGLEPSIDVWNKLLHLVVRFGSDRAVHNTLAAMDGARVGQDSRTRTILLQRDMIRQDVQARTIKEKKQDWDQLERYERPIEQVVRIQRRGGGLAQMRKIRNAIKDQQRQQHQKGPLEVDITPNLLLKNITRWTRECDSGRLVQLTQVVLGIDLKDSDPSSELARREDISQKEFNKVRIPAFRTLISAFERRGQIDLAKHLRARMRQERDSMQGRR
ncbi:uncharacterized protein JCM15063_000362 [Sporobolomyces koalae]|uniref:uncharacterized protein n=1 Tax=Sporobolomyces koalae TaxID=500713 RepID=UPI00316C56D8